MIKESQNSKVEQIICMLADNQKFAEHNDKLTKLISNYSHYFNDEVTEDELIYVTAAKMPEVPKYKTLKTL